MPFVTDDPNMLDDWLVVGPATTTPQHDPPARRNRAASGPTPTARPDAASATSRYCAVALRLLLACPSGRPARALFDFPEHSEPGRRIIDCGGIGVAVSGLRVIENFLDMAHFPFVHADYLGKVPHTEVAQYQVQVEPVTGEIWATDCRFWQPRASAAHDSRQRGALQVPRDAALLGHALQIELPCGRARRDRPLSSAHRRRARCRPHCSPATTTTPPMPSSSPSSTPSSARTSPSWKTTPSSACRSKAVPKRRRAATSSVTYRRWLRERGMRFGVRAGGMTTLKLYDYPLSGNCFGAADAGLAGVSRYETRAGRFLPGREHKSAAFLANINPLGQLPVIDDDGFVLRDAQAILVYLASRYDAQGRWYPDDPKLRGQVAMWLATADDITRTASAARLHDALGYHHLDIEALPQRRLAPCSRARRPSVMPSRPARACATCIRARADHCRPRLLPLRRARRRRRHFLDEFPRTAKLGCDFRHRPASWKCRESSSARPPLFERRLGILTALALSKNHTAMKTKAAVAWKAGAPLTIETVDLEGPKLGEVLVEIKATGICHTDYYTLSGADPEGIFPAILGHEGAGIVVDVGPGVTTLKKGDHVIPLYTPECRQCKFCLSRKTNLCQPIRGTQGKGLMPDAHLALQPRRQADRSTTWAPRPSATTRSPPKSRWPRSAKTPPSTRSATSAAA